jgi:O-acetyl-ADP-ribose deacetylase (regulator of RNase III)
MLFPIFGGGQGGADLAHQAQICITAAIDFLETSESPVRDVYFYVFNDLELEICQAIASNAPGLASRS